MKGVWQQVKEEIRAELPKNSFSLWINPLKLLEEKDNTLILASPNKFSRNWVAENYLPLLQEKLDNATGTRIEVKLKVHKPKTPSPSTHSSDHNQLTLPNIPPMPRTNGPSLRPEFTFDRFVVGPCNEFAYSASRALAQGLQSDYQSLLLLAKTGLGKTHLSHAVGNAILDRLPKCRIRYLTAEDFTNEMISSLKNRTIEAFKEKYRRSCDVLLLESIHFLAGKEKTQLELGHTLDTLANKNKTVIFTSSLPLTHLPTMSTDLASRITSGLITTLQKPDYETRVKIIKAKANDHHLELSNEIIQLLATRLNGDVRCIESAVKCIKAKSQLLNTSITLDTAKDILDCLVSTKPSVTPEHIIELISKYYKVDPETLRSKSRKKAHTYPRNIYVYLCRHYTNETLQDIASTINRKHTTALYALERVERTLNTNRTLRKEVNFLSHKLQDITT